MFLYLYRYILLNSVSVAGTYSDYGRDLAGLKYELSEGHSEMTVDGSLGGSVTIITTKYFYLCFFFLAPLGDWRYRFLLDVKGRGWEQGIQIASHFRDLVLALVSNEVFP